MGQQSEFWIGVKNLRTILVKQYPMAFVPRDQGVMKPLAIGIDIEIKARNPEIDPMMLRQFLKQYVAKPRYLKALSDGDPRVNLDGSISAEPTPEQIKRAAKAMSKRAA